MRTAALLFSILILVGCNEQIMKQPFKVPGSLDVEAVRFRDINELVFQPFRCTECHSTSNAPKGISLTSFDAVMASGIVNLESPESSRLFTALDSGFMPGNGRISQEQIDLIKLWIEQGAMP